MTEQLTAEAIRQIFAEELTKELDRRDELIGRPAGTTEQREELRKDAEFVRAWRKRFDAAAATTGKIILTAVVMFMLSIFALGFGAYLIKHSMS